MSATTKASPSSGQPASAAFLHAGGQDAPTLPSAGRPASAAAAPATDRPAEAAPHAAPGSLFSRFASSAVAALFTIVIGVMVAFAALSTAMIAFALGGAEGEHSYFLPDSPVANLLAVVLLAAGILLVRRSRVFAAFRSRLEDDAFFGRVRLAVLLLVALAGALWVAATIAVPSADQRRIQEAVLLARRGDWSFFAPDSYMAQYPHLNGLFWVSMLFSLAFGKYTVAFFQVFNVGGLVLVCQSLGGLARRMGASRTVQLAAMALCVAYLPLVQYTSFVYGFMWGLALALAALCFEMDFFAGGRVRHALAAAGCIGASILFKSNFEVFLIGMVLYALVEAADRRRLAPAAVVVPMLLCAVLATQLPVALSSHASGYEQGKGMSSWSWIAMGLQDSARAPGWFNFYNLDSYAACGYNTQAQAALARADAFRSLGQFATGERNALVFFVQKNASQWNNPTFQGSWITQGSRAAFGASAPMAAFLSAAGTDALVRFYLNPLHIAVLFGALAWILCSDWRAPGFHASLVLPLVFLGGFLLHTVWEGKCQYAFPYFVCLFAYAPWGYALLVQRLLRIVRPQSPREALPRCNGAKWAACALSAVLAGALLLAGGLGAVTSDEAAYEAWVASDPKSSYASKGPFYEQANAFAESGVLTHEK